MKTMKDYHNLYLKCDVFILTDAFEKIRIKIILCKEFLDIQATIACEFTLKRIRDRIRRYSHLVAIPKSKVTLTLNKAAYAGMCKLDLSKVLMYKFHYYYI